MKQAGGFIIQLMPFTEEAVIERLEENLKNVTSVTELLEKGHTPESLLETLLAGFDLEINEKVPTQFHCNCTKERVEKALISIGRKEIQELIDEGKEIEMNCHFCNRIIFYGGRTEKYFKSVQKIKSRKGVVSNEGWFHKSSSSNTAN